MYTINDSMFSLILRFVGGHKRVTFHDDEFVQKQLAAIRDHIAQFPVDEQELRAIEWIEAHAREYRKAWEKDVIGPVSDFRYGELADQEIELELLKRKDALGLVS